MANAVKGLTWLTFLASPREALGTCPPKLEEQRPEASAHGLSGKNSKTRRANQ